MAKKKSGGGSVGLILTLIFFVLTTFIGGTLAYFGYNDQEQFKKEAEVAKKDTAAALQRVKVEQAKTVVYRIALGTEDPGDDRLKLVAGMLDEESRLAIKKEYDLISEKFKPGLPNPSDFDWNLIVTDPSQIKERKTGTEYTADVAKADRDVAPKRQIPVILKEYKDKAEAAVAAQKKAEDDTKVSKTTLAAITQDRGKAKQEFDQQVQKLKEEAAKTNAANKTEFDKLVADTKASGNKEAGRLKALGEDREKLEKDKDELTKRIGEIAKKLEKLDQSASQLAVNIGPDLIAQDEKKGEIISKDSSFTRPLIPNPGPYSTLEGGTNQAKGTFVTINLGSNSKIKTGVTFAVIPAGATWRSVDEKERLVKGQIEVVEVLNPYSSRAKVIDEKEPIRDPIQAKDQLFNLTWNPTEEVRVAFAGIIDLDGDGIDNNDDFLRLLERQGVIVDEYLKLKPLEYVKRDQRGMTLRTKFLIIAADPRLDELGLGGVKTPQGEQMQKVLEKMSEMRARAKELGIQLIDARKFLALIGVKPPANPVPPSYGAAVYIDQTAPAAPKKDPQ